MTNSTRFVVMPDGTCAPLHGCMIIDVPHSEDGECDDAEVWIAENADQGWCIEDSVPTKASSYYDLVTDLLLNYSDEQLMQTATIFVPGVDEYFPLCISMTDESCDVLDPNHVILTPCEG